MSRALHNRGYSIREFILRTLKPAAREKTLARETGAAITTFDDAKLDADVLWIAVPDDAIEEVARRLAKGRSLRGKIVLHSAGALSSRILRPLQKAGAAIGTLHPMMSFSRANRAPELRGVSFAVEGDAAATRAAQRIVRDLGGKLLAIDARHKPLYHAFGAMIAPLLVGHLEAAERMAKRAGLEARAARDVMKPIVEQVLAAFLAGGAEAAFSGPLKRGDVKTIQAHLKALRGSEEETIYRALGRYAVAHIRVENKNKLKKLL